MKYGFDSRTEYEVDWNNVLLTVERAVRDRLEMPIVKVDVHAPIFYFPKFQNSSAGRATDL